VDATIPQQNEQVGWNWCYLEIGVGATMHVKVGQLEISGIGITTDVGSTEIDNITVNANIFDITADKLNIKQINIPELKLV